jgi:hypothetical protein
MCIAPKLNVFIMGHLLGTHHHCHGNNRKILFLYPFNRKQQSLSITPATVNSCKAPPAVTTLALSIT